MSEIKHEHDLEEAMTIIWKHSEKGIDGYRQISQKLENCFGRDILKELLDEGYITCAKDRVLFSETGHKRAYDLARRHRLTERLLVDVLHMDRSKVDADACEFEHIISKELEENICTLLGHPSFCPHGSPILPGECCKNKSDKINRVIFKLSELKHGENAIVSYMLTQKHPFLQKLMSLGLVPGISITLHSTFPAFIVEFDQTQLAVETEIAESIYVRKVS